MFLIYRLFFFSISVHASQKYSPIPLLLLHYIYLMKNLVGDFIV